MYGNTGRATVPEQVWALWRPVVVVCVVPSLVVWRLGMQWPQVSDGPGWLSWLPTAILAFGAVLGAVGLWWFCWAEGTFLVHGVSLNPNWRRPLDPRKRWKYQPPAAAPGDLITTGPYRYSTAPMIFGVFCMLWAEGFLLSPWVFVWAAVFTSGMTTWIIVRERPALRDRFGAVAREWQEATPFLIPWRWPQHALVVVAYWPARWWARHLEDLDAQVRHDIDQEAQRRAAAWRGKHYGDGG